MKGNRKLIHALLLSFGYIITYSSNSDTCNNTSYGVGSWMGDGVCDLENLRSECDWDGGNCCICTCKDGEYGCGVDGFLCIDPHALDDNSCEVIIPPPCPKSAQHKWVVENTADVRALAGAVNCSGGIFDVEWKGSIIVDTEIVVVDGTFLNLTGGVGLQAILDGGYTTRLFKVLNASLNLNNVKIQNGNATFGGAIVAMDSNLTLDGVTFSNNTANDKNGGAMFVYGGSTMISFKGYVNFFNNISNNSGGALYVVNSSVSWEAMSSFSENSASLSGGAICAVGGSTLSWVADASFHRNHVDKSNGGALFLEDGSYASWSAGAIFTGNHAAHEGGAIFMDMGSEASWSGKTVFSGNIAHSEGGGAILIGHSSNVIWSGETTFVNNICGSQGGAVSSRGLDSITSSSSGKRKSSLLINSTTMFVNNTCKSNGGGLAMLGGLSLLFEMNDTTFIENKADVFGGAVFISATGEGPTFTKATFQSNFAEMGGAIFITGSSISLADYVSATFKECVFIDNRAMETGGAMMIDTGTAAITSTMFRSNEARQGGALMLFAPTTMDVCNLEDNISEPDGGQAIMVFESKFEMSNCTFRNNVYDCGDGTFYNETGVGSRWEALCSGCDDCTNCTVENELNVSTCTPELDHTKSKGGYKSTLMTLSIDEGYWRATNYTTNILACYNHDACKGGLTGSNDFCTEGYTGPYCSVCTDKHIKGPGFTCAECSKRVWGLATAGIATILVIVITSGITKYIVSADMGADRGLMARWLRRVPLQSVKLIIVAWQILIQFTSVANVTYPDVYQSFLDIVDVLNFDISWIISAGCYVVMDFHGKLLVFTLGPILIIFSLIGTFNYAGRRHRNSLESLEIIRHKHVSILIGVLFYVYSSTSSVVLQTFHCEFLDDGKYYLRADYTIECDGQKHRVLMIYAGFMTILYPLGIPAFFAYVLFQNRHELMDDAGRNYTISVTSISDLWKPYKPTRFYYEVIECGRRIVPTGVILLVDDDSAAQIAVMLNLTFVFTVISEGLAPYKSKTDAWVCRLGHAVVFSSMYYALLLKVDSSNDTRKSQSAFEIVLIITHLVMVFTVIVEATVIGYSLKKGQVEDPSPRFWPSKMLIPTLSASVASLVTPESTSCDELNVARVQPIEPL